MTERLRSGRPPAAPEPSPERGQSGEEGQALLFAVISFMFVFVLIFSVYRTGWVSHRKMQMQNAADLAAYAGASVEANNVSMMAFVNRGMAFIYYNLMRYSVDCSVFALFKEYKDHDGYPIFPEGGLGFLNFGYFGARTAPDDWIATKGAVLAIPQKNIKTLYSESKERYDDQVPKGLEWVQDLYEINRGLAEATPLLVRKEVYEIATANGAERVCLYPDTKKALLGGREHRELTFNFDPHRGEENPKQPEYVTHEEDLDRWAYKIAVDDYYPTISFPIIPKGVQNDKIPEWYDAKQAKPKNDEHYYQIRECWNNRCMDHADDKSHMGAGGGAWPWRMKPAGHMHHFHSHFKQVGSVPVPWLGVPTRDGHQQDGHWHGPSGWTYYVPIIPMPFPVDMYLHHAVIDCPTCFRINILKWDADQDLSTDVMLELDDTDVGNYKKLPIADHWPHKNPSKYAPPLVLGEDFFKYGVNVGVWRKPTQTGNWLSDAEWGYFAVASAKAGPIVSDKVVVYRLDTRQQGNKDRDIKTWVESTNNLYHLEWGAKLIPVRDALYDGNRKTDYLMRGIINGTWMMNWRDPVGDVSITWKLRFMRMPGRIVPWNWNSSGPNDDVMKH